MHLANALLARPSVPGALDTLGCTSGLLAQSQELRGDGVTFYRKRSDSLALRQVATAASDRGLLLGVSLKGGHRRRIFHAHHASLHDFSAGTVYLRDFADDFHADLQGPFDFLLLEISREAMARSAAERRGRRPAGVSPVLSGPDPVLVHLARAVLPALAQPGQACALFIDQIGIAIATHLGSTYGGDQAPARKPQRLSRLHESRAKELLRERLDGNISVNEVAEACQLSRSYFIRAFRESTGQTPHQWLLDQRVALARELLAASGLPLVEVSAACGFADQSHFTRVFTRAVGTSPGHWRRNGLA